MTDPTPEQVRAVAEVLCGDGFDDRRAYCATHLYGGVAQIGACCREGRETAERILAAVRTDRAVQDAMLAALAEGGRLVEEARTYIDGGRAIGHRLVEAEWRTEA